MRFEDEVQSKKFINDTQKAQLNILFTAGWIKGKLNAALKPFSITTEQYNVMRILRGKHPTPMRVKDISSRMIDRNSNTTRIIDKLEKKKLLRRTASERDKREIEVAILPTGIDLLSQIDGVINSEIIHQSILTEAELAALNGLLDKMRG